MQVQLARTGHVPALTARNSATSDLRAKSHVRDAFQKPCEQLWRIVGTPVAESKVIGETLTPPRVGRKMRLSDQLQGAARDEANRRATLFTPSPYARAYARRAGTCDGTNSRGVREQI